MKISGKRRHRQSGKTDGESPLCSASYDFCAGVASSCFLAGCAAGSPPAGAAFVLSSGLSLLGAACDAENLLKDIMNPFSGKAENNLATQYYVVLSI